MQRPPITEAGYADPLRLADALTTDTDNENFSIMIKQRVGDDSGPDFVRNTMTDTASAADGTAILLHANELCRHYTMERSAELSASQTGRRCSRPPTVGNGSNRPSC